MNSWKEKVKNKPDAELIEIVQNREEFQAVMVFATSGGVSVPTIIFLFVNGLFIHFGYNWARILFTIIESIGILFLFATIQLPMDTPAVLLQTVVQIGAIALLFTQQARLYYKAGLREFKVVDKKAC